MLQCFLFQVFAIAVHEEGDRFEDTSPLRRSLIGSIRRRGSGAGKAKPITDAVPIQTVSDLSSSQVDSTLIDQSSIAAVNNPNIELKGSEIGWRHIVGILIIVVAATAIIARFLGFASSIRYFVGLLSILGVVGIYLTKYALPNRSEESSEFADDGSDLGSSKTLKRIKSFISIFSEKSNPEDDSKKSDGKRKSGLTRAFQRFFKKQRDEDLLTTSVETTPKAKQNKLASKITGAFRPRNDSVDRTTTDLGLDSTPTRNFNGRKKLAEAVRKLVRRRRRGDNKSSDAKNSSSGSEQGYDSREEPDAIETFSDDDNMNRTVPDIPIRSPNYSRTISKDSKSNSTSR